MSQGHTTRLPFFYGWVIVGLALLSAFWGAGVVQRSYAVILKPLTEDLGVTRTVGVMGVTIAALVGALASPLIGHWVDRKGPRFLMVLAAAMTGGALMALSLVRDIWVFLVLFGGVIGLARPVLQAVGAQATVAKWFIRRRGLAVTYSSLGLPLSAVIVVPLTQWIVEAYDWRTAWLVLGAGVLVMLLVPAGLLMRGRPEDMGLLPDGEIRPPPQAGVPVRQSSEEGSWTAKEAIRSKTFWMLAIGFAIIGMVPTILTIHMFPHFTDQGLSPATAAAAAGSFGFWVMGSRILFWGFALDRFPIRWTLVLWSALLTAAIGVMILVTSEVWAYAAAGCFGLAMGASAPLHTLTWARYFGRESLGTITGVASLVGIFNDIAGPLMPSLAWDFTGSYRGAFAATVVACLLGILVFAFTGPPRAAVLAPATREREVEHAEVRR